jgi:hypothetical protein
MTTDQPRSCSHFSAYSPMQFPFDEEMVENVLFVDKPAETQTKHLAS